MLNPLYYPYEGNGVFIAPVDPSPTPVYDTTPPMLQALETLLDNLSTLSPNDADFVDYLHCWLSDRLPRMEWQSNRVMDIYRAYGFNDCARGWMPL